VTEPALASEPYAGRMDDRSRTTPAMLAELAGAMRGRVVDGITIHDTDAVLDWGATGDLIVRLTMIVDDAPPGEKIWPLRTLRAIDDVSRDEAERIGIEEWVHVHRRHLKHVEGGVLPHRHR
jgi:hypothetical protein